jgi:hypothetical protein
MNKVESRRSVEAALCLLALIFFAAACSEYVYAHARLEFARGIERNRQEALARNLAANGQLKEAEEIYSELSNRGAPGERRRHLSQLLDLVGEQTK